MGYDESYSIKKLHTIAGRWTVFGGNVDANKNPDTFVKTNIIEAETIKSSGDNTVGKKLCIGNTCINEQQLKDLIDGKFKDITLKK